MQFTLCSFLPFRLRNGVINLLDVRLGIGWEGLVYGVPYDGMERARVGAIFSAHSAHEHSSSTNRICALARKR